MVLISNGSPIKITHKLYRFRLTKDYYWSNPYDDNVYSLPAGFLSDGASIPKQLQFIYGTRIGNPLDLINLAAYLHDYAFVNQRKVICNGKALEITNNKNNQLFYQALLDFGVNKRTATGLYLGVITGSRLYWPTLGRPARDFK